MEKEIYPCDEEWDHMVRRIMAKGGTLYMIERTDTNQLLYLSFEKISAGFFSLKRADVATPVWYDKVLTEHEMLPWATTQAMYPTRELADRFAHKKMYEAGCPYCGSGKTKIPIRLVEHEFIK